MTKDSVPVCGALTRAGTQCQNTLVTGCGRCPVHASQLRASKPALKPAARPRRKKVPTTDHTLLADVPASSQHPADTILLNTPDPARARAFQHPAQIPDHAFQALDDTPIRSFDTASHFHSPLQAVTVFLKDGHVQVRERPPLCSPVTPNTPEARFEQLYEEQNHPRLTTDDTALHAPEEALDFVELTEVEEEGEHPLPPGMDYDDDHF